MSLLCQSHCYCSLKDHWPCVIFNQGYWLIGVVILRSILCDVLRWICDLLKGVCFRSSVLLMNLGWMAIVVMMVILIYTWLWWTTGNIHLEMRHDYHILERRYVRLELNHSSLTGDHFSSDGEFDDTHVMHACIICYPLPFKYRSWIHLISFLPHVTGNLIVWEGRFHHNTFSPTLLWIYEW